MNSLLSETKFNIFENVILPKCSTLILLRHIHKEDWNAKKSDNQFTSTSSDQSEPDQTNQIGPASSDHQFRRPKEMALSPNSHNIWRPMSTRWKANEVYFPTQEVSRPFDFPIRIYGRITEDCSEGQESAREFMLLNFWCNTVPLYKVSWCMLHMYGKLIKSSFTPNKWLIVSTFE